jgi:hypothetical protein
MTDRELMQQALDALKIAEVDGNCYYEATELLRTRLAQPEQEPVNADIASIIACRDMLDAQPVPPRTLMQPYTTPPAQPAAQRKPLTDEWIHRTTVLMGFNPEWTTEIGIAHAIVRAVEAAHGIKEKT